MEERKLLRDQYSKQRRTMIDNFRSSQTLVPMVKGDLSIPHYRGVYSKGFVGHTGPNGIAVGPNPILYSQFIEAMRTRNQTLLNQVYDVCPMLVDLHCVFDVELEGRYKSSFVIPSAPSITSLQSSAEILEIYAMSLLRNFNFHIFDPDCVLYQEISVDAKDYLNKILGHLNIPAIRDNLHSPPFEENRNITVDTLFRGKSRGDLIGPYVSQLLYYETAIGNLKLEQKYQCLDISENIVPDISSSNYYFGKSEQYFREIWNGQSKSSSLPTKTKYITTPLDLAMYINRDQIWEALFISASLFLSRKIPTGFYTKSRVPGSSRFINLGPVDLYNLMMKATKLAMNSAWIWKWSQLRPRPEEMAYQIHLSKIYTSSQLGSHVNFPLELMDNPILIDISNNNNGKFLMPLCYSQGSPFHPSYPAGHAVIAGAMSTIMKAWFNCDWEIPAVVPDHSGDKLVLYKLTSEPNMIQYLKLGDEIDKLATNCSISRNMAGIHYRSDAENGILLGEQVAISVLEDEVKKYTDEIAFRFRRRTGEVVTIANHTKPLPVSSYPSKIDNIDYDPKGLTSIYSTPVGRIKLPNGEVPNITQNSLSVFSNNSIFVNETLF